MANPYILGGGNPIDSLLQGMQAGQGLRQNNQALQMQQLQLDEAKRQQELAIKKQQEDQARQVEMQADLQALGQNPTLDQQYAFNLKHSPDKVKAAQDNWAQMNEKQRQYEKGFLFRIGAAADGDKPEQVATMLENRAKLYDQNGDIQKAAEYRHWAGIAQQNPKMIGRIADTMVYSGLNADEQKQYLELRKLPSAIAKTEAEASNIPVESRIKQQQADTALGQAQNTAWYQKQQVSIATARLRLDSEKNQNDYDAKMAELAQKSQKLPDNMLTLQANTVADATNALSTASQAENLAAKLDQYSTSGKGLNKVGEWIRSQTGNETEYTALRTQTKNIINKLVTLDAKDLKPMSNDDIKMIQTGYPDEYQTPAYLAKYLRALGQAQRIIADRDNLKADWIGQNGGLGSAKQDIEINGRVYAKGTRLSDAMRLGGGAVDLSKRAYNNE
jgi:hypothetical protein